MFRNAFLTVVRNFLLGWINDIKHVVLKNDLKFLIDRFFALVDKLTDKNPENDREALEAFYLDNKASFVDMTLVNAAAIVFKKYGVNSPVATVVINGLIEIADNDGVPITDEIKALFPNLPYFSGAKMLEGQPMATAARRTIILKEGEKLPRVRRTKEQIAAAKGEQGVLPLAAPATVPVVPTDVNDANKAAVKADTAAAASKKTTAKPKA